MARDGDIVYEIRGDDSQLESDLNQAQRKAEQNTKETGRKTEEVEEKTSRKLKDEKKEVAEYHKRQNKEIVESDKESGKQREENEKTVSGKIKDTIKDAVESNPIGKAASEATNGFNGAAAAVVGLGAAAVAASVKAVNVANDMNQAMNGYIASTGKSKEETERYQKVLEGIYTNNYGDSFEDIAQAMATVNQQLGDLSDEELQTITESAFALRDSMGYDVSESVRSVDALMKNFGITADEAFNLIVQGNQKGLDFSGEMLDSINEYSVQFSKVGLSAEDMFNIMQKGAETGAWNIDKIGDAVKELGIRVIDGSETTREGFETIGLNADEMSAKFAAGGESAKEAFQQTIDALAGMEDPLEQNAAGVALFGTMWEDLGPEVVTQLADISGEISATTDAMGELKEVKYDDLGSMMEGLGRTLEVLLIPLGEALIPLLKMLIDSILPILTELLGPLLELFTALLEPILSLISAALQPLMEIITMVITSAIQPLIDVLGFLMDVFGEAMSNISAAVSNSFGTVRDVFSGIIDFIRNVFTGNWRGAWEAVKNIFSTICTAIGNVFKAPINFIIGGINAFIRGLNRIKIPDWVPLVGGKGFHISEIPRLRVGMDYVPSDDFPALLHRGEAVLTAEENAKLKSLGGIVGVERELSVQNYQAPETRVVLGKGCIVVQADINGKMAARAMAPYMDVELGDLDGVRKRGG